MKNAFAIAALAALAAACGKPLETREEVGTAAASASVAAVASRAVYPTDLGVGEQESLPVPSITVQGAHGGEATLSINPVGAVIGLVGQGLMFDVAYADYSVDGVNYLYGDVSVLVNFDYLAAASDAPEANFEVSFVGTLGLTGVIRDEARINLRIRTDVARLTDGAEQLVLRFDGSVHARELDLEFAEEDVTISWD